MRFVDAAADRRNDFIDDPQKVLLVLEAHRQRLKHAGALHVDAFVAVDQDIVDARVLEQGLERAQARHFVQNFRDEFTEFLRIQRKALDQHVLRNQLLDVPAEFFFRHFIQRRKVNLLDQPAVQPHLGVKQLVGEQSIFIRLRRLSLLRRGRIGEHCPRHAFERRRRRFLGRWQIWSLQHDGL